jgi:hypothetical protein
MSTRPNQTGSNRKWPLLAILASYVFALFTAFAAVGTGIELWSMWRKEQWPSSPAVIEHCEVAPYIPSHGRRVVSGYYIACGIRYEAEPSQSVKTNVRSRDAPEQAIWPDPSPLIGRMQGWVDQHPRGSVLKVHYDPNNPLNVVLTATDMPMAGPQLSDALILLGTVAAICGLLQLLGRLGSRS